MASLRDLSVVLGLLAMMSTACGASDDDGPSGPNYPHPSESAFCAALAKAQCSSTTVKACYASSDDTLADDTASCVDKRSDLATCRTSVTGQDSLGSPTYNPQVDTEGCIAAHKSVYADAALTLEELSTAQTACVEVFSGPSGNGAGCGNDYDCDTTADLRCILKPGQETGACGVPTEVGGGEDCAAASATCAETFYCDDASKACLKAKALDAACSAVKPCQTDLLCNVPAGEEEGVCEAKLGNNQDCTTANPAVCAGGFCNAPKGQTEGACAATLALAQTSASCGEF
ncbi:MAG: hypothetical protein WKG00_37340 [Polyangiaceae bacterium]